MNNSIWIWFDLDDTLYDFANSSIFGLRTIYTDYRLDRYFATVDDWIECYHRHNHALWDRYNRADVTQSELRHDRFFLPFAEAGVDPVAAEQLTSELDTVYLDLLASTGLVINGARETLAELCRRGYRIGILSNGFMGVQHRKLETSQLAPLIDCVVLSDEAGFNKPDRRLFDYALQKAATDAAHSVMVGDNPDTDIAGAKSAGWTTILFDPSAPISNNADSQSISPQTAIGALPVTIADLPSLLNFFPPVTAQ